MGELWHEGSQQELAKPVGELEEKWKLVPAFLQVWATLLIKLFVVL